MFLPGANCGIESLTRAMLRRFFALKKRSVYDERWTMHTVEKNARCETLVGEGHANKYQVPGAHWRALH